MRKLAAIVAAIASLATLRAQEPLPQREGNYSLRNETELALARSLAWLKSRQNADGSWSDAKQPGPSALALTAFLREPAGKYRADPRPEVIEKGCAFLRSGVKPDGSIGSGDSTIFDTSASLVALLANADSHDAGAIRKVIVFLRGRQTENGGFADPPSGAGQMPKSDLASTLTALEAIRVWLAAQPAGAKESRVQADWKKARSFAARCQVFGVGATAPSEPKDQGGFRSAPARSLPVGVAEAPSGAMTYAGLLCYIYAGLPPDAPRVQAALGWLKEHYTLEENPGAGADGYYAGLRLMAEGLAAAGIRDLELPGGKKVDWARQMALKILDLQQPDGSWVNKTSGRWRENDSALTTSDAALALEIIYWRL